MFRAAKSTSKDSRAGTVAIEYGFILPVLLLLTLGTMEISRLLWTYTTLHRAVEAAARCAAVNTVDCGTTTQIKNRAVSEAWGLTVPASTFTVATSGCGKTVTATHDFSLLIPGFDRAVTLTVSACYPQ